MGGPHERHFEILEKCRALPVWQQKEFLHSLYDNQTLVLVGETGSRKTAQVSCTLQYPYTFS
jgi:HrpA-like RNA helicase